MPVVNRHPPDMTSEADLLVVGGGPAGVTAAVQARQLGARGHLARGRPGRRHQPQPGTRTGAHPGPLGQTGPRLVVVVNLRARRTSSASPISKRSWPTAIGWLATPSRRSIWPTSCAATASTLSSILAPSISPIPTRSPPVTVAPGGPSASSWPSEDMPDAWPSREANWPLPTVTCRACHALPAAAAVVGAADTGCQIASILGRSRHPSQPVRSQSSNRAARRPVSISVELERAFQRQGIETHTNTVVNSIRSQQDQLVVEHTSSSQGAETVVDAVFFAVGWPPNIEHLGLEAAGIRPNHRESRSTPTCAPKSITSSLQATSTDDPCWSK